MWCKIYLCHLPNEELFSSSIPVGWLDGWPTCVRRDEKVAALGHSLRRRLLATTKSSQLQFAQHTSSATTTCAANTQLTSPTNRIKRILVL